MIEVKPETACMLYVGGLAITLLLAWLQSIRRESKKKLSTAPRAITCQFCHTKYLTSRLVRLSRCPTCKLLQDEQEG